ncbi:uncharacterized protein PV09_07251 [Verruconis gallopava]|uniref:Uncharacterized protein n=1 Tax=Verruconis gallopava TaxID=253628 RepID=A0A0D2A337_9PEZI|nr:uncharacterized protein PV09_07251 [Verruconis gallopava]KIW01203.1 hypothetical protein PV09_07251 [Verruconis gallopava]
MRISPWELLLLVNAGKLEPAGSPGAGRGISEGEHPSYRNAFHIFNAIHSSMRQWGSSLNHNGMSFFPALVPAGTELYHGTGESNPIEGMEWLAFEPEHAQNFARRRPGRHPGGGPGRGPPPPPHRASEEQRPLGSRTDDRQPLPWASPKPGRRDDGESGFLHTYLAKRDLQLLYIDGMSAGKTSNGTLDTQDYILLNNTLPHQGMWEYERAQGMCNISRDEWGGRVDGFLRMEAGFEIILCDFQRDLEVKSIARAYGECKNCDDENEGMMGGGLRYLRAVADRYHDIGGERVKINYEKMTTVYALDVDLFSSGERGPRLKNVSAHDLAMIRRQVDRMVLSDPNPFTHRGRNWQAVADMIVTRFATRLKFLAMPDVSGDEQRLNSELNALLSPFIDYDKRSFMDETSRCASHFTPSHGIHSSLAAHTVSYVSHYICHKLVSTQYGDVANSLVAKQDIIADLIETLNWTTWKECGTCAYDEICSIPIWPFGSEQDWITPTCRNSTSIKEQRGYWGFNRGFPGGPPPDKDEDFSQPLA